MSVETDEALARRLQEEELRAAYQAGDLNGDRDAASEFAQAMAGWHHPNPRHSPHRNHHAPPDHDPQDDQHSEVFRRQDDVRVNVLGTVGNMTTILKFLLVYGLTECILTTIVIARHNAVGGTCSMPLHIWCMVHSARWLVSIPYFFRRYKRYPIRPVEAKIMGWNRLFGLIWFFMAHAWIYNASECRNTDTAVYYYSVVLLSLIYLYYLALPLLLLSVCLCLPCVLCFMSRFANDEAGANGADIAALRTFQFDPATYAQERSQRRYHSPTSAQQTSATATSATDTTGEAPAVSSAPEDAPSCAICCQPYEPNEELRVLPCDHDFHTNCIDHWLRIRPTCPMCRGSISGASNSRFAESLPPLPPGAPGGSGITAVLPQRNHNNPILSDLQPRSNPSNNNRSNDHSDNEVVHEESIEDYDPTRRLLPESSSQRSSDVRIEMSSLSEHQPSNEAMENDSSSQSPHANDNNRSRLDTVLNARSAALARRDAHGRGGSRRPEAQQ